MCMERICKRLGVFLALSVMLPIAGNAATGIIVGVPQWAMGVAFVLVIGWLVLKFLFGLGESAVDSIGNARAKNEDQKKYEEMIQEKKMAFGTACAELNLVGAAEITKEDRLDELKSKIDIIFGIEIYDDKHLVGKRVDKLEGELVDQLREYGKMGGIL